MESRSSITKVFHRVVEKRDQYQSKIRRWRPKPTLASVLSRNSQTFIEPQVSLPCLEEPATGPYPKPDASRQHLPILFP